MTSSKVLVAGAGGFLGANLCRILGAESFEVHGIVRAETDRRRLEELGEEINLHILDLTDLTHLEKVVSDIRPDAVINAAAATSSIEPRPFLPRVVRDTISSLAGLLEACDHPDGPHVIHLGSSTEYGKMTRPHREEDHPAPVGIRGITKLSSTMLALSTGATVLRIYSVYGPLEDPRKLIPTAIRAGLEGRELPLTEPGFRRDWIFIEDVVEACIRVIRSENCRGEIFNIGSGVESSNEDVVRTISDLLGKPVRTRPGLVDPRPEDCSHWCADTTKARRFLGWTPRHDLRKGLDLTMKWVKENRE